ncbi:MAG: hypothetical protein ACFFDG_02930 [Promethearchaeota archaeon]
MSDKQSNSSKKSNNSKLEAKKKREKLKLSNTSKPRKSGSSRGSKSRFSRQGKKNGAFKAKLKSIYNKLIYKELAYLDGKEPAKSYSYEKKFYGLYGIFILYSLLLITAINLPGSKWVNILMFGNPFVFSNTIVAFFLVLSFLFSIDKFRIFIFEKKSALKQLILYCGLIALLYTLLLYISTDINFMTYLLTLAMIWLILLSSRFYLYSRKFSTKIEARFIKKYSIPRYFFAIITPFFILGVLVIISLFFRSLLVWLSLDFFGNVDPQSAVGVYNLEMNVIMPLIYFSLVMTLVFIIFEFVFTRRRAETRRAGTFDNFTFSLVVFFIFFFQLLQIGIFMLLQDDTITAFKATIGATGSAVSYIFIFEFLISMYFLYRIIRKMGRTLGWRILFFNKDGLILLCLGCVLAQTLTRFSLTNEIHNQVITDVGIILMSDKYIVSVLMIFFLGSTLLIYYLKPHETSMFMRLQKETVTKEEENMDKVYKIIRSEYIRRGKAYPIEIIERELIKATHLSKGNVHSLLEQLAKMDMNIELTWDKKDIGKPKKMIDFVSVTERFERKGIAEQKARRYLSERLYKTAIEKKSKTSRLGKIKEESKPTDYLVSSLSAGYDKKERDREIYQQRLKETQISFTNDKIKEDLIIRIIPIIKKEYMYRIENPEKIPFFYIPISEISAQIEQTTKINPGELYQLLKHLNKNDLEFNLIDNPEDPNDKIIQFLPFSDDNMIYSLAAFRPEEYSEFRIIVTKNFLKALKTKKEKRIIFQLRKEIQEQTENQKSWLDLLNSLYKYYPLYIEQLSQIPNKQKLLTRLDRWKKVFT